jgi:isoquinoline 1-oxidoreductase beta subunit
MSAPVNRREFVKLGAIAGAGLVVGFQLPARRPGAGSRAGASESGTLANGWVVIAPDGTITVLVERTEMGQGVLTSIPMIIAEELDADWSRVRSEHMIVANTAATNRSTGGSASIRRGWKPLRTAGAAARAMLVQAAAQQWGVDPATCSTAKSEVIHAASGRRLSYGTLAPAAAKLEVPKDPPLKDAKSFTLIGRSTRRLDSPSKVDGSAKYGIDTRLPGMLVALVARCSTCGGRVKRMSDVRAKRVPGVRQVVPIEGGVAVVAEGYWPATQGRRALEVEWEEGAGTRVSSSTIERLFADATAKPGVEVFKRGNPDVVGTTRVEATYELPLLAHAPMEPMNCTAQVRDGKVEVWAPVQNQRAALAAAAKAAGVSPEMVTLHTTLLGGGFGRRLEVDYVTDAVHIAKAVGAPVQVIWSREDDMRHDFYRPASYHKVSGSLDAAGMPVSWTQSIAALSVMKRWAPDAVAKSGYDDNETSGVGEELPYPVPHHYVDFHLVDVPVPVGWWRAVGLTSGIFVVESYVDELAHAAGKDPVAYRRSLLSEKPRMRGVLDLAAEKAGWGSPLREGRARGVAVAEGFGSNIAQVAEVSVQNGAVRVHRVVCAIDCGIVINPDNVEAQIESGIIYGLTAALKGAITLEEGQVVQSNFHDYQMLRMREVPAIEVHIVPSTENPGGIGEPGTPPIAPAVANAIFAATGRRIRRLPIERELKG